MIKVISNISVLIIANVAWSFAKIIPNAWSSTVYVRPSLNLVSSSCDSPSKIFGKIIQSAGSEIIFLKINRNLFARNFKSWFSYK